MEITVYGTRSGAFCNAARQLLDNHGITFVSVLMDNDGTLRSSVRKNSQRDTCPQIWLGKEHIGGYSDLCDIIKSGGLINSAQQRSQYTIEKEKEKEKEK